jgi:hypothetical protein
MQEHQHTGHSNSGGGPAPTPNPSTPVTTCQAHGTVRTGGTCSQCQATGDASTPVLGWGAAGPHATAHAGAGMPAGRTAQVQAGIAAYLLSQTRTPEGQAFAREYDGAAETLAGELKELNEPGLTPGAPHPDPVLAAKGWHVCRHGIYTRHPDGPPQAEPEAR